MEGGLPGGPADVVAMGLLYLCRLYSDDVTWRNFIYCIFLLYQLLGQQSAKESSILGRPASGVWLACFARPSGPIN